jgi:Peptidase MA superfamily/Tetratricopeptide repeat
MIFRWFALLALSVLATPVFSDVIHLKNGRQIECKSAWEDGKEVRYKTGTGVVSIPRAMVAKIVKSDSKPSPQTAEAKPSGASNQTSLNSLDPATKTILSHSFTDLGKSQVEKKDFTGALENFKKAYTLVKDRETTFNLAMVYFQLKDDWNSELLFNELLKLDPKNTIALNMLGEIAWRKERLDEALDFWQKSLQIKKDPILSEKLGRLKRERRASSTYDNSESLHFIMRYDGGKADPDLVNEISSFLEEIYQRLSMKFDAFPTTAFVIVLYPQEKFQAITDAPIWSGGINDGKIKLPIKGVKSLTDEMKESLVHELTHSFVNFKSSGNCPVWLQEGLAQHMEGKQASDEANHLLGELASAGQLPRIEQLNGSFIGASTNIAQVLYVQSLSFTVFLLERQPFYQVNNLLDELGKGNQLNDAFQTAYLQPLSRMESEWRQSLGGN